MDYESKERIFFENWMTENEYEYDNIPIEELLEAYHKAELDNTLTDFLMYYIDESPTATIWDAKDEYVNKLKTE